MKLVIIILAVAFILSVFFGAIVNSGSEMDKLDEDREQEEYLEKWKEKRDGKTD